MNLQLVRVQVFVALLVDVIKCKVQVWSLYMMKHMQTEGAKLLRCSVRIRLCFWV